jgi:hypothetical protein
LESRRLPQYSTRGDLVRDHPSVYLDWFGDGWNGLVPLRELPAENAGRVKAYRKQAADGTLAPVLLWWVSGFDGWLVLDGHCRLVAAQTEGIEPPMVQLSLAMTPDEHAEPAFARGVAVRTRAWPLRGGVPEWERTAATSAPDWPGE